MKLTKQDLIDLHLWSAMLKFVESCDFDAVKIWNTCERGDWLFWWLCEKQVLNRQTSTKLACIFVEHILPIYESKRPDDKHPRLVLEAALAWSNSSTDKNKALATQVAKEAYKDWEWNEAVFPMSVIINVVIDIDNYLIIIAREYAITVSTKAKNITSGGGWLSFYLAEEKLIDPLVEAKWQANKIRELIPCPFEN
jgi:hypothetical protein